MKGVFGVLDSIDNPSQPGAKVKLAASQDLLDRVGITKKEESVGNTNIGTIYILPPKKDVEYVDMKVIDHEE